MLVSLATGFSGLLVAAQAADGDSAQGDVVVHGGVAHVRLSADVALGCIFLAVYNVVVLVLGVTTGRIPKRLYVFARLWYCLYFVLACLLGFHILDEFLPSIFKPDHGGE